MVPTEFPTESGARSLLRATALQAFELTGRVPEPAEIVSTVNRELCRNNGNGMFITLFAGILDAPTGRVDFVNAGHVRPYRLFASGAVAEVACRASLPLGIIDGAAFVTTTVSLAPHDGLVVLTDGLHEAMAPDGAFYTMQRVVADLEHLAAADPAHLIDSICNRVLDFTGTAEQADDVTALALRLRA